MSDRNVTPFLINLREPVQVEIKEYSSGEIGIIVYYPIDDPEANAMRNKTLVRFSKVPSLDFSQIVEGDAIFLLCHGRNHKKRA